MVPEPGSTMARGNHFGRLAVRWLHPTGEFPLLLWTGWCMRQRWVPTTRDGLTPKQVTPLIIVEALPSEACASCLDVR